MDDFFSRNVIDSGARFSAGVCVPDSHNLVVFRLNYRPHNRLPPGEIVFKRDHFNGNNFTECT